ncbi:MAG: MFS transporter, partial [Candidatus Limnocylindria bacterium]
MTREERATNAADGELASPRLGLRENAGQFALLVGVNGLVGGMIGQERTILPLMARDVFGLTGFAVIMAFIVAFGVAKAFANLVAGVLADRYGRKPVLVVGWLLGLPVPLLLIWAPDWGWVIVANILLGLNQGLAWSSTVIMKIDLVGPSRRGLAMGLNEAAGYVAVALTALATGYIASQAGLRPTPFYLGLAIAGLGVGVSVLFVRETRGHVALERSTEPTLPWRTVFGRTSLRDPSLSAASQAGLVNNLNDGMAWGLLPLFFASHGLSIAQIGVLAATYPAVWGFAQIATGALSDRIGRKGLIVGGMLLQAAAIGLIAAASTFGAWLIAAALLGLGTAMVYP